MKPRVSICTTVLNQSEFLRTNIESVIAQTFTDWEQIIIDDGSTEDIKAVVDSFNDPRLIYLRFDENKGSQTRYNDAMELSSGDYIELLSADEFLWPQKLEIQVPWMDAHPDIGCTWGLPTPNIGHKWELGERPTWEQFQSRAHNRSREAWVRTLINLESIPIGGASMLMRRECYEKIGGFDPQFHDVSDLEWFVRFFQNYQGHILPYRLADAVHPDTRLSSPDRARWAENLKRLHAKHTVATPPTAGKVSIGIPCFNMEKWVSLAISSVISQSYQDIEIIVLDDASTDGSAGVIQSFGDRIKYFKFDENRGTVAAINQMAALATGEWYVSLAADDLMEPTTIERMVAQFVRDPWLEFVATQTDFIDADGKPDTTHPWNKINRASNKSREQWLAQLYYGNNYFGVGMYRRKVLLGLGGWDATHGVLTDYELYLRLLQRENIHVIEENLTHTRIHAGNKSLLSVEEGRKLAQRYHDARLAYYQPRMKVIIATPFYEMRGFSPYISSLCHTIKYLTMMGIEHTFFELSGDSYVDRAKNTLFAKFLEDPDATDLFMIDSDMQWEPQTFIQFLMLPHEIVMGSYPQKNMWEVFTARPELREENGVMHPVGQVMSDGSALIKAAYLAGGFIRIKRAALLKYKEHYKDLVYQDHGADPSYQDRLYTEFFTCERAPLNGVMMRWGEDRVFGKRMSEIGIEGWIYPNANFGHYGIKGWQGNFDTYLRTGAPQPQLEKVPA